MSKADVFSIALAIAQVNNHPDAEAYAQSVADAWRPYPPAPALTLGLGDVSGFAADSQPV